MKLRILSIFLVTITSGVLVGCVGSSDEDSTNTANSGLNDVNKYQYNLTVKLPTATSLDSKLVLQVANKSYLASGISCQQTDVCLVKFTLPKSLQNKSYQLQLMNSTGGVAYQQSGRLNVVLSDGNSYDFLSMQAVTGAKKTQAKTLMSDGMTPDACSVVSSVLTFGGDMTGGATFLMIQSAGAILNTSSCGDSGSGDITVLDVPDPFPLLTNEVIALNTSLSATESSIQNITQQLQLLQQLYALKYINTQAANLQKVVSGASSNYNALLGQLSGVDISQADAITKFLQSSPQNRKNIEQALTTFSLVQVNAQVMAMLPKLYRSSNQDQILGYQQALQSVWNSYSNGEILTSSLNNEANFTNLANFNAFLNVSRSLNNVNFEYSLAQLIESNFPQDNFKFMKSVAISSESQVAVLKQYMSANNWISDQSSLISQQGLNSIGIASINAGFGYYSDSCNIQDVDETNLKITASCHNSAGESMPFATFAYGKCNQSNGQYRIWNPDGYLTCDDTSEVSLNQLYFGNNSSQLISWDATNYNNSTNTTNMAPYNSTGSNNDSNNIKIQQYYDQGNIFEMITYGYSIGDETLRCPHISSNSCEEFTNPNMVLLNGTLYMPAAVYDTYQGMSGAEAVVTNFEIKAIKDPAIPLNGINKRLVESSQSDYQVLNGSIMPNNIGVTTSSSVTLKLGDSIQTQNSNGNNFIVVLQATDGNLVQYRCGDVSCTTGWSIWASGTNQANPNSNEYAYFSNWDGRLVIYDQVNGSVLWSSNNGVDKNGKFTLHLQTDGNFYIDGTDGTGTSYSRQINEGPSGSSWRVTSLAPSGNYLNAWPGCRNPAFINGQLTAECRNDERTSVITGYPFSLSLDYNSECKPGTTVSYSWNNKALICNQPK